MAKKFSFRKFGVTVLTLILVVSLLCGTMSVSVFAGRYTEVNTNYEWYKVYVQGALAEEDHGPKGDENWLVSGVYRWNVSISGTTMTWTAGNQGGRVDLTKYVNIPDGFSVKEFEAESITVDGVNTQSDRYDNAIINVTIKVLYNENTQETITVDPVETDPVETDPVETQPVVDVEQPFEDSNLPVKFYVLDPNRTVPLDGADQGINSYYPAGTYSSYRRMYVYETNLAGFLTPDLLEELANSDGDGVLDIGDILLVDGNDGIAFPIDWQGLWDRFDLVPEGVAITAYVIKVQNPNDYVGSGGSYYGKDGRGNNADIHVDCFVSNLSVKVTYHPNFTGATGTHAVDEITGRNHSIRTYDGTGLPTRDGFTFEGWALTPNGRVAYTPGESFQVVGYTDLYAVWKAVETEPEVTEPEVTEPEVTEPEVTEPEVTEPEVTEPEETIPEYPWPKETEPEYPDPVETEPDVTQPVETKPEETKVVETEPKETEPEVTEPVETIPTGNDPDGNDPDGNDPDGGDLVDIGDDDVPLTDIPDEDVPLTGDSITWFVLAALSAIGLLVLKTDKKKKENA